MNFQYIYEKMINNFEEYKRLDSNAKTFVLDEMIKIYNKETTNRYATRRNREKLFTKKISLQAE